MRAFEHVNALGWGVCVCVGGGGGGGGGVGEAEEGIMGERRGVVGVRHKAGRWWV